jgi:hypothetical protein
MTFQLKHLGHLFGGWFKVPKFKFQGGGNSGNVELLNLEL